MSTFTEKTKEQVLEIARRFVDENQPPSYKLVVRDAHASEPLQEWIVWVDTEPDDVSATDYARRLVEIEELIREQTGEEIVLHPGLYLED